MITCKDCKHWDRVEEYRSVNIVLGECVSGKFVDLYGDSDDNLSKVPKDGLGHGGYETFDEFYTGEDFGCIHGEEK